MKLYAVFLSLVVAAHAAATNKEREQFGQLARQVMLQQLFIEERIRSEGDSGIKLVRHVQEGTRPYHGNTYASGSVLSIHDHSNYINTIGMGEFIAVLNGVEFRTRHNDYKLVMPSRTKKTYHATDNIPLPDVPPEVLKKPTVKEQMEEMKEWFRAWRDSNYRHRDYRKYFKANLCYLEGAWLGDTSKLEEPFQSDRHSIAASSWMDLQEKIRFSSYSGKKHFAENHAYLPTTIIEVHNNTPVFAQWNYRILCHPIKRSLSLDRLRVIDDFASRMAYKRDFAKHSKNRAARFQLNWRDSGTWTSERFTRYSLLDELMAEIPGKDNYPGKLVDESMFSTAQSMANSKSPVLNAGYYHRWYKGGRRGAMGTVVRHRGFSDENMFAAMNSQTKISSLKYNDCYYDKGKKVCGSWEQRWSFAIPLEIVYTTPLMKWNPYNIAYHGYSWSSKAARAVTEGGRYGSYKDPNKAYNGTNHANYYLTPVEFFTGEVVGKDPADTSRGTVGVLDRKGVLRKVQASGIRVSLPNINGVGIMRIRYPIAPSYQDGNAIMKEVQALKDLVMQMQTYSSMMVESPGNVGKGGPLKADTVLSMSSTSKGGLHTHTITINAEDKDAMVLTGSRKEFESSINAGHSHRLRVYYDKNAKQFYYDRCDNKIACWDGHAKKLYQD